MNENKNISDERFRIWSEISEGIDEMTGELFLNSDELYNIVFQKETLNIKKSFFKILNDKGLYFRLENDEELFFISIIDRKIYPRVWADNFKEDSNTIISESTESLIQRSISGSEKDWLVRFHEETIEKCMKQAIEWINKNP